MKDDVLLEELFSDENISTKKFLRMLVSEEEFTKFETGEEEITTTKLESGGEKMFRTWWKYTNEKKKKRIMNLKTMINNKPKMLEALKKELEKEINL